MFCLWESVLSVHGPVSSLFSVDFVEVIHDLDAFEEACAVGGHMRFLKPKSGVTVIAVRGGQRYQVRQRMHSVVLKTASINEKAFYEALGSRFAALEPFLRLGWKLGKMGEQRTGKRRKYLK